MNKFQKSWRVFRLNLALSSSDEQWQRYLHHHQEKILDFDNHSESGLIDVYIKKALAGEEWYQPKRILSRLLEAGCMINPLTLQRLDEAKANLQGSDVEQSVMLQNIGDYLRQHLKDAPTPLPFV